MKGVGSEMDQFDDEAFRAYRSSRRKLRVNRGGDETGGPLRWISRLMAWGALAAVFFALGYVCSGWLLNYMDERGLGSQPDVVSSPEQVENLMNSSGEGVQTLVDMGRRVIFPLYVPGAKGKLTRVEVKVLSGLMEEDLTKVVNVLLEHLEKEGVFASDVGLKHVFRDGEMLYLDFNESFKIALSKMSAKKGALVMTGLVRTVVENFVPVTRVQFLVDGSVEKTAGKISLSVPWELRKSS
ncbi:MAG: hypothetical protein CSA35_04025 [Dethiosulfovibrio peptidovorans]|nr:MAG: hypothetical protein CSA35_04025 [Dethiosulfovibrio peptidovorans]